MAHDVEMIEYLSKEIETHTTTMVALRSTIHFSVFAGPFVVLGAVLVSGKFSAQLPLRPMVLAAIVGLISSYGVLGFIAFRIERQVWTQCGRWRALIAKIISDEKASVTASELRFDNPNMGKGYAAAWAALMIALLCTIAIVSQLTPLPTP